MEAVTRYVPMMDRHARMVEKLLALSWKEPYGTLMLHGKIETRTWPTKYRGMVLMCTSKIGYSIKQILNISGEQQYERIIKMEVPEKLQFGVAIAVGRLVDCRPMKLEDEDKCFVRYNPDLFCHVYEDVVQIKQIPWKGKQGWSNVSMAFIENINFLDNGKS